MARRHNSITVKTYPLVEPLSPAELTRIVKAVFARICKVYFTEAPKAENVALANLPTLYRKV